MANSVQLSNFTDFDRLLLPENFFITIFGALGAFALSYLQIYVPIPIPPYNLAFSLMLMMVVVIYTSNIASSLIVALVGSCGIIGADGLMPDIFILYLIVNILTLLFLGYLSDRLKLVMDWNRSYFLFAALFSTVFIVLGNLWNPSVGNYTSQGVNAGSGGNLGTGIDFPVLDYAVLGGIYLFILAIGLLVKGESQLSSDATGKYKFFGILFFLLGQVITIVPLFLFMAEGNLQQFSKISGNPYHLTIVDDLFTHTSGKYAVYGEPFSVFHIMAVSVTLTFCGIVLLRFGKYRGNMEGTRGGSDVIYFGPPVAFLLFFGIGSYYVQNLIAPGGLFILLENFALFASMMWMVWSIQAFLARILLFVYDRS